MKTRTIIIVLFALATAIGFSSCRKCVTCKAYDRQTNIVDYEIEYCGMSKIVNDQADTFEDIWDDSYTRAECK